MPSPSDDEHDHDDDHRRSDHNAMRRERGRRGLQGGENDDDPEDAVESTAPMSSIPATVDDDTLRIMISTDNHLGYAEKDPVRGTTKTEGTLRCLLRHSPIYMFWLTRSWQNTQNESPI
jgi:hypothetical protein